MYVGSSEKEIFEGEFATQIYHDVALVALLGLLFRMRACRLRNNHEWFVSDSLANRSRLVVDLSLYLLSSGTIFLNEMTRPLLTHLSIWVPCWIAT